MGSKDLWLALISQFEYPIRILAARAAVAVAVATAADDDGVEFHRKGATQEGNVHPHWNVHSKHNTGRTLAHKRTHTHFITACLYHQSVIRCPRAHRRAHTHVTAARLHHQSTMGPAAHHLHHCQHWLVQPQHHHGAHANNINRAVTWRTPRPMWFFCFAGCPFLDAWAMASLAWSIRGAGRGLQA
eukprot:1150214-Pelagomonas_calceolata.AAC.1